MRVSRNHEKDLRYPDTILLSKGRIQIKISEKINLHRLPLTSVRCGGLETELQRDEKKRHGAEFARKEAESEEKGAKGENDEAGVSGYQPVRVKRVDLVQVRVYHVRKDNFRQLINKY